MKMPKEYDELVVAAEAQGWKPKLSKKNSKLRLFPPDGGPPVSIACTPHGGRRGVANTRAAFKRAGLKL